MADEKGLKFNSGTLVFKCSAKLSNVNLHVLRFLNRPIKSCAKYNHSFVLSAIIKYSCTGYTCCTLLTFSCVIVLSSNLGYLSVNLTDDKNV